MARADQVLAHLDNTWKTSRQISDEMGVPKAVTDRQLPLLEKAGKAERKPGYRAEWRRAQGK